MTDDLDEIVEFLRRNDNAAGWLVFFAGLSDAPVERPTLRALWALTQYDLTHAEGRKLTQLGETIARRLR